MDVDARLSAIIQENEKLHARIAQLEEALRGTNEFMPPVEWRLTGSEVRVFGVLLKRSLTTKDAVMAALYRDDGKDEPDIKIVDVFICKMRAKLKPFGIEIKTVWGRGYALTDESRAKLKGLSPVELVA
jgi:two-component system cell cycle response regulator CtrA